MKKPKVLFLCRHNSCRSQMAEALLRDLAGARFDVASAGSFPAPVHPLVDVVMAEVGVDTSRLAPKSIDMYLGKGVLDYIITVCGAVERDCPRLEPFALHVERWPMDDPSEVVGDRETQVAAFRKTRDELRARLVAWLESLPAA